MIAYQFDNKGHLVGTVPCQKDPLESKRKGMDIFLVPANSTTQVPPEVPEGQRLVWTGSLWITEPIPMPPPEPVPEPLIGEELL